MDDPRNTDNAWIESKAVNYHDEDGKMFDKFHLEAGDDAVGVRWMDVTCNKGFSTVHGDMVKQASILRGAYC